MKISEIHGDKVQALLLENLGDKPELVECSTNPEHGYRQVDVGLLMHGKVQYQPCLKCMARDRFVRQGVPPEVAEATRKNYSITHSEQQHQFNLWERWVQAHIKREDEKTFLLMLGTVGTGKSHLATAAFKALGGGW